MSLLLNSDIEHKLNKYMVGQLARVGGKVDQLLRYEQCTVEDINVENRRLQKFGTSSVGKIRYGYDIFEQEIRYWRKGYRAVRDRMTHFFDVHEAVSNKRLSKKYDGILSSNVIEHSYNAIWFLLNMHFLVKNEGYHYHAIPYYRLTYDQFRTPTPLEHFIDDFRIMTTPNDCEKHAQEHFASVLKWSSNKENVKLPSYPCIHCHVFDEYNTKALFELIFEDVSIDIIKTDEFQDVLVLCRNTLNSRFRKKFKAILKKYSGSKHFIGSSCLGCNTPPH